MTHSGSRTWCFPRNSRAVAVTNTVELDSSKRPLFILLDATWTEARKIFRKSPYFERCRFQPAARQTVALPLAPLDPQRASVHREVAALCLELAGDSDAASALDAYFDVSASIIWVPNSNWI